MRNLVAEAYEASYDKRAKEVAAKLSAMHLLYTEAILIFDEIREQLASDHKIIHDIKYYTNRIDADFKFYNDAVQKVIPKEQNLNLCEDLEDFDKQFRKYARLEEAD